ncbi:MAG: endonuclease, partial [Deltaproteobacteria bacterium]|nr:endonuclease [Deltaproteobacteria bacterium]
MSCPHPRGWFHVVALVLLPLAAACNMPQGDKAPPDAPHLAPLGKTDVPGKQITPIGALAFGGEVHGVFVEDEQVDGYTFVAKAGARITLDNSNLATSRNLDSTLFLYGPANKSGFFGGNPITIDDDSGWGLHARIKNLTLPSGGQYLAVLGTYAGADRGRYRLALTCEGDTCIATCDAGCDDGDAKTQDTCDPAQGCVHAPIEDPKDSVIVVNAPEKLITSEARQTATFTVHITKAPTETVIVWVKTSDPGEGECHPTKLIFCKPGFHEGSYRCSENTAEDPGPPDQWKRTIPITLFGTRDAIPDGDVPYRVSLSVETNDPTYAKEKIKALSCVNQDISAPVDYSDLEKLKDDELLRALAKRLGSSAASYGYLGQNSARTVMFSTIDNHDGLVESIYTNQTIAAPLDSSLAYAAGFNTEHTWPQSQFQKLEPMVSDLHHIFPADISSNGSRSSYDFGWVSTGESPRSTLGRSISGTGKTVYQVRPEMRGDVARAHFYLVARYKFDETIGVRFDDDDRTDNGCIRDDEETVL